MSRIAYHKVAPDTFKAMLQVKTQLDASSIDARLRAMVELRASQINGCLFCIELHSREARAAGETQQRMDCLPAWREAPMYTEREKAALAWTEAVTLVSETGVPDAVYEQARKHFSEKELTDLTFIVAIMNAWNRIAVSFRQMPQQH